MGSGSVRLGFEPATDGARREPQMEGEALASGPRAQGRQVHGTMAQRARRRREAVHRQRRCEVGEGIATWARLVGV